MKYDELLKSAPEKLLKPVSFQFLGCKEKGRLIVGLGALRMLGDVVSEFGSGRVLVIADPITEKLGTLALLRESLSKAGIESDVYNNIKPEPHIECFQGAQEIIRAKKHFAVIGMGGGSSMDIAKTTAIMANNDGDVLDYCLGKPVANAGLPCVLIPTTSGTGSEVSPYIVTSADNKKLYIGSPHLFATVALVDPVITATMPRSVTASTGIDALTHAIEGYIGKNNAITETFTSKSVEYVFKYLLTACNEPENLEARYYMSWAAIFGMLSYSQGGGLYAHSLSYILTLDKNTPHGVGCGVGLANTLMYNIDYLGDSVGKLLRYMADNYDPSLPGREKVKLVAQKVQNLIKATGLAVSLKDLSVREDQIEPYAIELHDKYYRTANPRELTAEDSLKLMKSMWFGTLEEI